MAEKKPQDMTPEERMKKCFDASVKYIAASPRSEKEVKEKLYAKGYHKNEVEEAIAKCKKYKYIDDEAYVNSYIEYYGGKVGRRMIAFKLTNDKGVSAPMVTNIVADVISDSAELDKCRQIAASYIKRRHITEKKDYKKVGAYLFSKGFDWDIINRALNTLGIDDDD